MRTTTSIMLVVLGLALARVQARADDPAKKYEPRAAFGESDTNHDGVVDHEEFQERITEVFYSADTNKDGVLDAVELERLTFPDDCKHDKNGNVTLREFLRVRFHDYDVADTDHDGVLSVDEVVVIFEGKKKP